MTKKQTEQTKTALVLRCCAPDMSSKNGFVWPGVGEEAVAPDWKPTQECGQGLHGWLYGQGDHGCSDYYLSAGAKWLVVEVELSSVVMLGGKVKFPRGVVRFVGEKHEAEAYLIEHEPQAKGVAVIGASLTVGDEQAVIVGALGTATAGDRGELRIRWWDYKEDRYRTAIAYVGEDGIEPNVAYRLNDKHEFVRAALSSAST